MAQKKIKAIFVSELLVYKLNKIIADKKQNKIIKEKKSRYYIKRRKTKGISMEKYQYSYFKYLKGKMIIS